MQSILRNYRIQLSRETFPESFSHIFINVWAYRNLCFQNTQSLYLSELFLYIFTQIGFIAVIVPLAPNNSSFHGCQKASDFSSAHLPLFLRKFYDYISCFSRVFRVFSSMNFLYAQISRSQAQLPSSNSESTDDFQRTAYCK